MLRSLFAVIVAVIAGLTAAKLVEGGAAALFAAAPISAAYQVILVSSWLAGGFVASLAALLIARRWAPVGLIAAASIFLSAAVALLSAPLSWLLWPGGALAVATGAFVAIKLTKATFAAPVLQSREQLFND